MIKRFDRYIMAELVGPFFFGLITFSSILIGGSVLFPLISQAAKYGVPFLDMMRVLIYQIPQVFLWTFPMSSLLASIFAFNRLNADREIMGFRSSGIGFFRMMVPALILSLFVSVIHLGFSEFVVPKANQNAHLLLFQLKGGKVKPKEQVNLTEYNAKGQLSRLINVVKVEGNKLFDITVAEFNKGRLLQVLRAPLGYWNRGDTWELENGLVHIFNQDIQEDILLLKFKKEQIDIAIDISKYNERKKRLEEFSALDLLKEIEFKKKIGEQVNRDLLHFYLRFSLPFASFIFCLLGASVGLGKVRQGSSLSIGVSLGFILLYYLLYSFSFALAMGNVLPAWLAAWFPNIVTGIVGLYFTRKLAYQ